MARLWQYYNNIHYDPTNYT